MSQKVFRADIPINHINTGHMKLGQNLFKKDQPIWGKPLIEYDQQKMNEVFSEIPTAENAKEHIPVPSLRPYDISLETELYLILHS